MSECSRIIQPFGYKMPFRVIAQNGAAERMILDTASLSIAEMRHLRYQIDEYFNFEFRKAILAFYFDGELLVFKAENIENYFFH